MPEYTGKSVCSGIAIGRIHVLSNKQKAIVKKTIDDIAAEKKRLEDALSEAKRQLSSLYYKTLTESGEEAAAIFEIHKMMLEDDDYLDFIKNIISQQSANAEYAVSEAADNFSNILLSTDDAYMKERAADVCDISQRLICVLNGSDMKCEKINEPCILLADDLTPSETIQLDKNMILGFVTVHGSVNSHTAILARTMNIPSLVSTNVELSADIEGKIAIVDGFSGKLYTEPDETTLSEMAKRRDEEFKKQRLLQDLKGKENITKDGRKISVYANISNLHELQNALENDADGIGLFRSEFIYLESSTCPTEDEQFAIYKKAVEAMAEKLVIVRTLDIGADKQADYFELPKEDNPALGLRGIRICLTRPEIFRSQLRALYRASKYGNIAIMYPMITSIEEVLKIKDISAQVRKELDSENIPYNKVLEGIMIETPAAVMISDLLAKEVDFFSIGTNDLSQYTMAIDRQSASLDVFFNSHHEAVLRMIEMVCKNAHANGIRTGICGELGADLELTERFLRMGVDELSVSPAMILPTRERIRSIDLSK